MGIRAAFTGALCFALLGSAILGESGEAATTGKTAVSIQRSPFRVSVISASGRSLLKSIPGDFKAGGVRYGGLGFSVGREPELVPPVLGGEAPPDDVQDAPKRYLAKLQLRRCSSV